MAARGRWLLLLAWLLPAGVLADAVADGLAAWGSGDYRQAHASWLPAAQGGDPQAMFLLSELYARGRGVPADQAKAMSWLRNAAEGGHAPACYNLGDRYLNGDGVAADPARAAFWWRQAAVQGLMLAQYNLGTLYYRGLGVPADPAQAAWWYRQAADQGSEPAREALAALQDAGVVVPEEEPPADGEPAAAVAPLEEAGDRAAPAAAAPGAPRADLSQLALGVDWLRRQPAEHFTVQVFASNDPAVVRRFLARYRFSRQVAIYPFKRAGEPWYGVIYGRFATSREARAALAELPEAVRKGRPWLRRVKELTAILDQDNR